jgi:hypothetical protein
MKIEAYLFFFIFVFLAITGGVYLTYTGIDLMGGVPLYFSAGLALIIGYYLWYTGRRCDPRPEDRAEAEVEEGAGELGFFSPHSWWPLPTALGAMIVFYGMIFGMWLLLIGVFVGLTGVTGFVLEYYVKEEP